MFSLCPLCQTGVVPAPVWSFSDTSVTVPVCDSCQSTGAASVEVRVSAMAGLLVAPEVASRHLTGLVWMS